MISIRRCTAAAAILVTFFTGRVLRVAAQSASRSGSVDLALTYVGQRSLRANTGQNFWSEGGSLELGADFCKGFGFAADLTGSHTASIGSSGIPLSLVTETFGPRYRWHDRHNLSPYVQGLVGEANAFHSLFPSPAGTQSAANSIATQIGGGLDFSLRHHLAARLDAAWLRTQLPNSTNNVQNILRIGGGIVLQHWR